jgi:hypothetical protein
MDNISHNSGKKWLVARRKDAIMESNPDLVSSFLILWHIPAFTGSIVDGHPITNLPD